MPGRRTRGFKSKAQWRFFFAKGRTNPKFRKWAHEKAHATAGGPKIRYRRLPGRKGAPTARTLRGGRGRSRARVRALRSRRRR
jgi:hypothetical protein